ncbi:hypothetical protein HDV06_005885 [Boothiomyces sp. JEL0866]|nr:hypothetical protein HDV06_005885 [Boothiomyces sp. JEL0866]
MNTTASANAPAVFQIAWINNSLCSSPPNVMYSFAGITTTLYNQTISEQYSLTSCGNNLFTMNGGCCFSNIDTNYLSGYASLVQRAPFPDKSNFPLTANGASYCHIQQNSLGALYGYADIWFLADSTCINNFYLCNSNGEFHYFNQPGCAGQSNSIQLYTNSSMFTFADMGNIKGEFLFINDGAETYTWTAYIPSSLLTFKYQVPMEILALICYLGAIIISAAVLIYFSKRYSKTKSSYMTVVVASQILWVLWILLDFMYLNIVFPQSNAPQVYAEFKAVLFNLASLTTVLNTANFIVGFRVLTGLHTEIVLYATVFIVHILLAGGNYFTYYYLTMVNGSVWQKWIQLAPLWTFLMFIFNTLPAFSIAVSFTQNADSKSQLNTLQATRKVLTTDKKFAGLVSLQVFNIIFIGALYYIQQFTQIPGSDRNYLAMFGIFAFVYALHAGLNCLFIEHSRTVLKSNLKTTSLKKPRKSEVMILRPLSSIENESCIESGSGS